MTRAMLLSAGLGTRMRPLTDHLPKPLIPIAGTTLIEHNIRQLKLNGITEIVINLGYLGDMIKSQLGNGHRYGVTIEYSEESADNLLGSGGGVKQALPLLGEAPFVLVSADIWWTMSIQSVVKAAVSEAVSLWMIKNPEYHTQGDLTLTENGKIQKNSGENNATFSGVGIFCPSYFRTIKARVFGVGQVIQQSIEKSRCTGYWVSGLYENVGSPKQLDNLVAQLDHRVESNESRVG